jgi:molybdopterin molybdotransferase
MGVCVSNAKVAPILFALLANNEAEMPVIDHLPFGLDQALALTLQRLGTMAVQQVDLLDAVERVVATDLFAEVNAPSIDASLKDGYAVMSTDITTAVPEEPVRLRLMGMASAGGQEQWQLRPGHTVRVLTGAPIPDRADAVLSEEYVHRDGDFILACNHAETGRNIQRKGSDVMAGERVVAGGRRLSPGQIGVLAAAGHSRIPVFESPRVAVIATGDEVVAPGLPLTDGKLYASNIATLCAWCRRFGMTTKIAIVRDDPGEIRAVMQDAICDCDAVLTSGGAWTGDRDLVARILQELGWQQIFHRIRIGPGKAVGFGMLQEKPIFILPGGPPSNLIGFLQIALPGLLKLAGENNPRLPTVRVRSARDLNGRYINWTQFIFGFIEEQPDDLPLFHPIQKTSRLHSMAEATAVAAIPEGVTTIAAGELLSAQLLANRS